MAGGRRKARVFALQILYEVDAVGHDAESVLNRLLVDAGLDKENGTFIHSLVNGVIDNKIEIDR